MVELGTVVSLLRAKKSDTALTSPSPYDSTNGSLMLSRSLPRPRILQRQLVSIPPIDTNSLLYPPDEACLTLKLDPPKS